MEKEKEGKIKQLNQEYNEKTSELSRNETKYVREEFEKFDSEQSKNDFSQIENHAYPQKDKPIRDKHIYSQTAKTEKQVKRHPILNSASIILALIIVAGAILYGLYHFSII